MNVHSEKFAHWQFGPENVYGENIYRDDWRIDFYGMRVRRLTAENFVG